MKTLKIYTLTLLIAFFYAITVHAQDVSLSKSFNKLIDSYIVLKNTLISGDGNTAENNAKDLMAALSEVQQKAMTPAQSALWTK